MSKKGKITLISIASILGVALIVGCCLLIFGGKAKTFIRRIRSVDKPPALNVSGESSRQETSGVFEESSVPNGDHTREKLKEDAQHLDSSLYAQESHISAWRDSMKEFQKSLTELKNFTESVKVDLNTESKKEEPK